MSDAGVIVIVFSLLYVGLIYCGVRVGRHYGSEDEPGAPVIDRPAGGKGKDE